MVVIAVGKNRKPRKQDSAIPLDPKEYTLDNPKIIELFDNYLLQHFATSVKNPFRDPNKSTRATTFQKYKRENIVEWLLSPETNETNLRNASIYMWNISLHYRRLIKYYVDMLLWSYIVLPVNYDGAKGNIQKAYAKAKPYIENMNIKHEFSKALMLALRDGVFYGVSWSNNSSFFLQRINPDLCRLTAIEDGTWLFAVDMSKIKEEELVGYPPEFTSMWNVSKSENVKYVEVPSDICFCIKADEITQNYSLPVFAAVLPSVYDIDYYKGLQSTASEIDNYKLLHMKVPVDKTSLKPTMQWEEVIKYRNQMERQVPEYIALTASPMDIEDFTFEQASAASKADKVALAEEQYWTASGTSSLLFGSPKNDSSTALRLSITADEAVSISFLYQVERLINRHLKGLSGTQKFRIQFLPVTIFNYEAFVKQVKEAATYGIPTKAIFASALGVMPIDVVGLNDLEMNILGFDNLTPMVSSHNGVAGENEGGRPSAEETGDPLSDTGANTRDNGDNDNKKV